MGLELIFDIKNKQGHTAHTIVSWHIKIYNVSIVMHSLYNNAELCCCYGLVAYHNTIQQCASAVYCA